MCEENNYKNYRIRRTDPRNITVQKRSPDGKRWKVVAYCGNSPKSLVRSLTELFIAEYVPEDEDLVKALESLENALLEQIAKIEEWISTDTFEFKIRSKKMSQKAKQYLRKKTLVPVEFRIENKNLEGGMLGSLVGLGYVKREGDTYKVTEKGKEWINSEG